MTSVTVEKANIGTCTFARCNADCFEPDVLTITSVDTDAIVREFRPGTWLSVSVYDEHGHLQFSWEPKAKPLRLVVLSEAS